MRVIRTVESMRRGAALLRSRGRLGLVPTMGCLHEGHLSLVRACRGRCDHTVVSVFVNPTQFGPGEDFRRYPRDLRRDRRLLEREGVDVLFCPSEQQMYRVGFDTHVDVGRLTRGLCGRSRPGHFRGVATVVAKLFNIVRPHVAVFGQKDAQQTVVIRRMARDLDFGIEIMVAPTVREPDGLAMSSRNAYLSPVQRREAAVLHRALALVQQLVREGETAPAALKRAARRLIARESHGRVQYVEVVDADGLEPVARVQGRVLFALAVFFGKTRLIDNVILHAGAPAASAGVG